MKIPIPVVFLIAVVAWSALAGYALEVAGEIWPKQLVAWLVLIAWLLGFLWLVGAIAGGGAKSGWIMLRYWIGINGGLAIAAVPFAFLPHVVTLILGVVLGVAFGAWCLTGKAYWLHRD